MREKWKALKTSGPFWNMLGSAMVSGSTVLLSMAAGRFMDMALFGGFTLALTTAQLLYVLSLFGGNDLQMVDYTPRFSFGTYARLRTGTCLFAGAAGVLAAVLLQFSQSAAFCCFFLTVHMIMNAVAELWQSAFFQHDRLDLSGKSCFFRYLLTTAAFVAGFAATGRTAFAFTAMLAANVLSTWWWCLRIAEPFTGTPPLAGMPGCGQEEDHAALPDRRAEDGCMEVKRREVEADHITARHDVDGICRDSVFSLLRQAAPAGMSVFISQLIINCPRYMIGLSHTDEVQGVYHLLFLPTYVINMLGLFIFRPLLHAYADAVRDDRTGLGRMLVRHAALIAGLSLLAGAGMYVLGPLMIGLLFHQDVSAYRLFQAAFMVPGGMMALSQLLYYLLVMEHKQIRMMMVYMLGGLVTIFIGINMIPRDAVLGAWASFSAGQAVILLGFLISLGRHQNGQSKSGHGSAQQ